MKLAIYTDVSNPRIVYTMEFVFRYVLNLDILFIISDKQTFIDSQERKLNYSKHHFSCKYLHILPSQILHQKDIRKIEDIPFSTKNIAAPNKHRKKDMDPFGIIFFMISRYEEYLNPKTDLHGRFPAAESVAYQNGFLEYPIVDAWIDWIRRELNRLMPEFPPILSPPYQFTPTYDIDHVRAYLWKGLFRTTGGIFKDIINWNKDLLLERIKVLSKRTKDPYDIFNYFDSIHQQYDLPSIYFWLLGDFGTFDKNPHHRQINFRKEIRKISLKNSIGIHPSYLSFLNPKQIQQEIRRLKTISEHSEVNKSRFHFLRFKIPDSYRLLFDLGITDDYSMAFPEAIGFRAGTSHPFYWYDLENECSTTLKIHPFQVMDVSLKNYMYLSKEESIERIATIIQHTQRYGGHFVSLWHNSSFHGEEWKGWKSVYEQLIHLAQEDSIPNS